ncbi:piggyBac transposable element-derived protein 4 [Anguilla anguilla]|uniref:piggyBac transposable element-derived protein 4 n=1 Tax=Anguilla anguilla TaxID=7936 RepID=UPI0015B3513C|nr:piggyBac transposable element-derived protein 4 [Anguilla anguilla]
MPSFSGQNLTYQMYLANVMRQLLEEHHTPQRPTSGGRSAADNPLRLTARHFLSMIPQTKAQGRRSRRHCKVCLSSSRKRKQKRATKFMCAPCNTCLCAVPCLEEYHTLKHYEASTSRTATANLHFAIFQIFRIKPSCFFN